MSTSTKNNKKYKEILKYSCGHVQEIITLGYKMERKQVKIKQQNPCPSCQLKILLRAR